MIFPRKLGAYAGLDLSLAGTGGVLLGSHGAVISTLAFSTSAREAQRSKEPHIVLASLPVRQGDIHAMWARTVSVAAAIRAWLNEYAEPACLVGIEDHAFGARGTSIYQLGHLHGLVRRDLQEKNKRWLLISPTELKAAVTGKGNADKNAMMRKATPGLDQEMFGASTRNNVVDAYWLARLTAAWDAANHEIAGRKDDPSTFAKVLDPHGKLPGLASKRLLP